MVSVERWALYYCVHWGTSGLPDLIAAVFLLDGAEGFALEVGVGLLGLETSTSLATGHVLKRND